MKKVSKKIMLMIICFILLALMVNPVFALEKADFGKTTYQWSDYSNKPAEFWIELYNIMQEKYDEIWSSTMFDEPTKIYSDEYNLMALAYNNFEKIETLVENDENFNKGIAVDTRLNNYVIPYALDDLYDKFFEEVLLVNPDLYDENNKSGIEKTISNNIKKKEYRFELFDKMYWAKKLAQTYAGQENKEKLTSSQQSTVDYLKTLVDSNYSFPTLTDKEKKEATKKYDGAPDFENFKDYILSLHQKIYGVNGDEVPDVEEEIGDDGNGGIKPGKLPIGYGDGNATTTIDPNKFTPNISASDPGNATKIVGNIVSAINVVGSVVAVVCVMVVGIKYMFASVEQKAEYKKMLWPMLIGAMLIFGIILILNILYSIVPSDINV